MPQFYAVHVWSGLVRLTHWLNAFCILLLLALGSVLFLRETLAVNEDTISLLITIHVIIGFVFAGSLGVRLAYMFAGPVAASHWSDVIPHTKKQWRLMKDTLLYYLHGFKGECPLYFAHNPFAGLAYTGFFVVATCQVLLGTLMYLWGDGAAVAHAHGSLAVEATKHDFPAWLLQLHDAGGIFIALFIVAHLVALFLHDFVEVRGLASSMISGRKFFTEEELKRLDVTALNQEESHAAKEEG